MRIAVILIIIIIAYGQYCQSMSFKYDVDYHNPVCEFLEKYD